LKLQAIRKNLLIMILIIPLFITLAGCVYLVVGGIGAVGGYIVSPDTVEGVTENDALTVWDAAVEIVSVMGIIEEQYEESGLLVAKINRTKVEITIISINDSIVKLRVKARRALMPRVSLAQDVYVKIVSYLNE